MKQPRGGISEGGTLLCCHLKEDAVFLCGSFRPPWKFAVGTMVLLAEQGEQHGLLLEEAIAFLSLNNPSAPMCAVHALMHVG